MALTRADLRYLMQQYADAPRTTRGAVLHYAQSAGVIVSLAVSQLVIALGWPPAAVYWAAGPAFAGIAVSAYGRRWRRERFAFHCPECRTNLIPDRAEAVMVSGRCPACGHELFAP